MPAGILAGIYGVFAAATGSASEETGGEKMESLSVRITRILAPSAIPSEIKVLWGCPFKTFRGKPEKSFICERGNANFRSI